MPSIPITCSLRLAYSRVKKKKSYCSMHPAPNNESLACLNNLTGFDFVFNPPMLFFLLYSSSQYTAMVPCHVTVLVRVKQNKTWRSLHERIKEHDRDIRLARTQTSSKHINKTGHLLAIWNEVKFIHRDPHWYTRRVKEAIHIILLPNK